MTREAGASKAALPSWSLVTSKKLELPKPHYQAGAWERISPELPAWLAAVDCLPYQPVNPV